MEACAIYAGIGHKEAADLSKTELAQKIAENAGFLWSDSFTSQGEHITGPGLRGSTTGARTGGTRYRQACAFCLLNA